MGENSPQVSRRGFLAGTAAGTVALAGCMGGSGNGSGSGGNEYPNEDMTYIVPFSQGGGTDTYARKVIPALGSELDVGIAIENVPGAASLRGTGQLMRAQPNGYTFGGFNPPSTPISYLLRDPNWDITNLTPVATYGRTPYAIFARPETNIDGLQSLINKYQSGELTKFGGLGRGGIVHVAANIMESQYGLQFDQYIGYDGAGPAIKGAISGEVPAVATTDTAAVSAVESGRLKPIAILSSSGSSVFPNTPSPTDAGFKNIDYIGQLTRCMYLPPETSTEKRDQLESGIKAALDNNEVQEWSDQTGNVVEFGGHEEAREALVNSINQIQERVNLEQLVNA